MNFDFTPIVQAVIALAAAVITSVLIPWIKVKVAAENIEKAKNLVKLGVQAAEQILGAGVGEEKYNYVVNYVSGQIKIDPQTLKNMIESAVLEMNRALEP